MAGSSNEITKYNYKGKTYYFSHDTWLDSIFITVPDEIGIELAYEFNRGKKRYHYKNQKEYIRRNSTVVSSDISDKTITSHKAVIKPEYKNSFGKKEPQQEQLEIKNKATQKAPVPNNERITLAIFLGVKSSLYAKVPTKNLGFASIIMNRFTYYEIDTLEKLLNMTWDEVIDIRVIGAKRAKQIEDIIRDYLEKNPVDSSKKELKRIQEEKQVLGQVKDEVIDTKPRGEEPKIKKPQVKEVIAKESKNVDSEIKKYNEAEHDLEIRRLKAALAVACCVILILLCKLIMVYYF